jgi:two-component system cell cycle response regulator
MVAVVVELSRFIQGYIVVQLQGEGWTVHAFDSGQQALDAIRGGLRPRLVCTSHFTKDLGAMEFRKELGAIPTWDGMAVLVTSDEGAVLAAEAKEAGFRAVLPKSHLQTLSKLLEELCATCLDEDPVQGRVLYVEDSRTAVAIVRNILAHHPVVVDDRPSVDAALEAFDATNYDLVITDYTLEGGKDGLDLVRALRRERASKVPILVLSGLESSERKVEILRSGASDFVAKPVIPGELIARAGILMQNKHLIDELEAKQTLLFELAMRDPLTGLFNRRSLFEMAPKELSKAKRHQYPVSLILLDLDHFKHINDKHGHQSGDQVLREVGALLPTMVRDGDLAARFGGEEFVVLLSHCTEADAAAKAEAIRQRLEDLKPGGLLVTGSFGVAGLKEDGPFEALFKAADEAAYLAKANGRNRVEVLK